MALFGAVGCAKDSVEDPVASGSTSATETSGDGTTTDSTETGGTTLTGTDTDDTTDPQTNTSGGFYAGPDIDFPNISDCDPFAQDCPEGEKCVPYGSTGGNWDANKCVPVTGDGQAGDPCTYGGVVEATDDCGEDTHCWDVMDVDGMNVGICTLFCTGTADDPICPDGTTCIITNEGSINMCITNCDPLLQECGAGLACYYTNNGAFACIFTTQDIPTGDPCGFINDCEPGNSCATAELLPDCNGSGCCADFCDVNDVEACPDPALECTPFFDEEQAPPNYEHVGLCVLPGEGP